MKTERQARKTKMIFLQCLQTPDICKHPSTHKEITLAFETLALKFTQIDLIPKLIYSVYQNKNSALI